MAPHPPVLIEIAVEPKAKADQQALDAALDQLAAEDSFLRIRIDPQFCQAVVGGASEAHLERAITSLRRSYGLNISVGAPQVAYREKITRRAEVDHTHKKQAGGTGQFARLKLVVEPNEPGAGYEFESKIGGGTVPARFIPGVEKGLESVLGSGVLAGCPVVDLKVQLVDGAYHEADSSALAFEMAARAALREALQKGGSVLLEPIVKVEVVTPPEHVGAVLHDLKRRRGFIVDGAGERGGLRALVPFANMFGYDGALRTMTHGRANCTIQFDHLASAPTPTDDPPFRPAAAMRVG